MRHAKKLGALLLTALMCLTGGSAMSETANPSDIFTRWEVRDGSTSETTLPTPDDFPAAYDYGSGLAADWGYDARLPALASAGRQRDCTQHARRFRQYTGIVPVGRGKCPCRNDFFRGYAGLF